MEIDRFWKAESRLHKALKTFLVVDAIIILYFLSAYPTAYFFTRYTVYWYPIRSTFLFEFVYPIMIFLTILALLAEIIPLF